MKELGKLADLVLLAANLLADIANTQKIDAVVVGGRLLERTDLDQLLDKARIRGSDSKQMEKT